MHGTEDGAGIALGMSEMWIDLFDCQATYVPPGPPTVVVTFGIPPCPQAPFKSSSAFIPS